MIELHCDGASRGNPGPAAAGFHAEDATGRTILEGSERLQDCTNNVAEYRALLMALDALLAAGHRGADLRIALDSELVVKQLNGDYAVRHADLKPLHAQVRARLGDFGEITVRAVPREQNRRADALANRAFAPTPASAPARKETAVDCIFCKIVAGTIPAQRVWEDEQVIAFRDVAPAAPTHVLVVPRRHCRDLGTAPAEVAAATLAAVPQVAKQLGLEAYRVIVNNGAGAGQTVFHLHIHVLAGRPLTWPPG